MNRKLFILTLFCCLLLVACSEKYTFTGTVVSKNQLNDNGYIMLVIKNINSSELKNKSIDELIDIASLDNNGMNFYIDKKTYEKVEVGKKVEVKYSGPAQESLPPKVSAKKVKIIDE
jgi:uncharacterized OB-fold protein